MIIEIIPVHPICTALILAEFVVKPPASTGPSVGDGGGMVLVTMTTGVEGGGGVMEGGARDSEVADVVAVEFGKDELGKRLVLFEGLRNVAEAGCGLMVAVSNVPLGLVKGGVEECRVVAGLLVGSAAFGGFDVVTVLSGEVENS
jgi:hypothetical protein